MVAERNRLEALCHVGPAAWAVEEIWTVTVGTATYNVTPERFISLLICSNNHTPMSGWT